MSDLIEICEKKAKELHETVPYGADSNMFEQVKQTRAVIEEFSRLEGQDKEVALAASLLYKTIDPKCVKFGKALSIPEITDLVGPQISSIIQELTTEPKDKSISKSDLLNKKIEWAKSLSPVAKEILLAEKIVNFETTCKRMKALQSVNALYTKAGIKPEKNPTYQDAKSKPSWHKDYLVTRAKIVDILAPANPRMYIRAKKIYAEAMVSILSIEQQTRALHSKLADRGAGL